MTQHPNGHTILNVLERIRAEGPRPHGTALSLLKQAVRILERSHGDPERACWRIADALLLLGEKFPHASGIARRTGRGAKLAHEEVG